MYDSLRNMLSDKLLIPFMLRNPMKIFKFIINVCVKVMHSERQVFLLGCSCGNDVMLAYDDRIEK